LAMRLALGATRWAVVRQLLLEGLLLATLASVCSVLLLMWLGHRLPELISVVDFRDTPLLPDLRVVAFAVASALPVGAGFSLLPALEATRFDLFAAFRDAQGCAGRSRGREWLRKALVVVQVAGSLALLSAGCLCVRATYRLFRSDMGFRTDQLAIATVDLEKFGFTTNAAPHVVEEIRRRLLRLPGVEAVGMTDTRPFSFDWVTRLDGFKLRVSGALAALGLLLTTLGAYSVVSYLVVERRREIGVRVAIGARRSDVTKLIFRFGLGLAAAGVGLGLPAAAATAWALSRAVSDLNSFDLIGYLIASAVLLLAVLLACWLPAARAARIDPMTTLRVE